MGKKKLLFRQSVNEIFSPLWDCPALGAGEKNGWHLGNLALLLKVPSIAAVLAAGRTVGTRVTL